MVQHPRHLSARPTRRRTRPGLLAPLLVVLAQAAGARAQTPFETAAAGSEQTGRSGTPPQLVAETVGDALVVAAQLHEGSRPVASCVTAYVRAGSGYVRAWARTLPLPRLVGLTSDGRNVFVASAIDEDLGRDVTVTDFRAGVLVLSKFDAEGNLVFERDLNDAEHLGTNRTPGATAIYSPLTAGTGALAYGNGKVVVALASNTLPDTRIGRRHQRAQVLVVGADGGGSRAASETSWRHSFDQRLLFDGTDFVFTDLADAGWYMPGAGIALRKIQPTGAGATFAGPAEGTYVYMRQGETAGSQNYSFTSLGDLAAGARGYVALFTSERSNPGVARNGWQTPVAEPRQLGMVHVVRGFEAVLEGSWNGRVQAGNTTIVDGRPSTTRISPSVVDSRGPSQTFTRPDNEALSFTQTGVVWLTELPSGVSAERPKLVRIAEDRFVALWEEWTYEGNRLAHRATMASVIDEDGHVLRAATSIGARLNPSGADRPFVLDGRAAWITGVDGHPVLNLVDETLAHGTVSLDATDSSATPPALPAPSAPAAAPTAPAPAPSSAAPAGPSGPALRITNRWRGPDVCLDAVDVGGGRLVPVLAACSGSPGQGYVFASDGRGGLRITTRLGGAALCLDVVDGSSRLVFAACGARPGQRWRLVPDSGGSVRLMNDSGAEARCLDVVNDATDDQLHLAACGNYAGQFWSVPAGGG